MHAEKEMLRTVWWPAFGHFQWLHPEYEVIDYRGGSRFLDFAYIRGHVRIAIEVDGYGPHQRDLSRKQFCEQWVRQTHLTIDGWVFVRIGFDDVKERPRLWQQLLQQLVGRLFGNVAAQEQELDYMEMELIRLAARMPRPLKRVDVEQHFHCTYRKARSLIQRLENKQWLMPAGTGSQRTHAWRLQSSRKLPM
jgi:hypothetical protein